MRMLVSRARVLQQLSVLGVRQPAVIANNSTTTTTVTKTLHRGRLHRLVTTTTTKADGPSAETANSAMSKCKLSERAVTTPTKTSCEHDALEFLAERGRAVGANLTLSERKLILKEFGLVNQDGTVNKLCRSDWEQLVSRRSLLDREYLTLSEFLAKSHDGRGQKLLQRTALAGAAFFSMCASHLAGAEADFHVVGATLVGCVTALGGGTFNALVTGSSVGWVRNPTLLMITVGASLTGFYVWPLIEDYLVSPQADEESMNAQERSVVAISESTSSAALAVRYWLESIALGALAVSGAQQGIIRGLHPLTSSCLGVTVALGGVVRDLMCGRDLTLGAAVTGCQSYGVASLGGSSVYVALRELHVYNCAGSAPRLLRGGIPIGFRIFVGFGTVLGIRYAAWIHKPDGLLLTMDESTIQNKERIQRASSWIRGDAPS